MGLDTFRTVIQIINQGMDIFIPILFAIGLTAILVLYAYNKIQTDGLGKGFYLSVLFFLEIIFIVAVIYYVPKLLTNLIGNGQYATFLRWLVIYSIVIPGWYSLTKEHSGKRGAISISIILFTFSLGWLYDQWIGVIFISTPLIVTYYHVTYKVAQIIYPTSDPENKREEQQRVRTFIAYLLGIQYPIWIAKSKTSREYEKVIDGDTTVVQGGHGVIYTWSHQVAGISKGIEFNRVDGPNVTFTKQFEWPVALVDLRTQLRVTQVNTITKDGMEIPSIVFTAFAIDKENWPKPTWSKAFYSKLKYIVGKDYEIDHPKGSHPYSSGRVRSALSISGINTSQKDENEKSEIHWDEWVIMQVEHVTRQVVSERSLDELWRPRNDELGKSALDEMADDLKSLLSPRLAEAGIQLFTARIVNYKLDEEEEKGNLIAQQNLKTWSSYWEQRVTEAQADIEFIYREEIDKAHAYSKSILLSAIADSIDKARKIREDLPRHVIAQYFVHALEEYIKKVPELDVTDFKQRIDRIKDLMTYSSPEEKE
ncbi:MAG: hypothetical protein IPP66_19670 [Anaerolineales bacterium]|nr:hypothetical protein [Anaerolineales bacterium]